MLFGWMDDDPKQNIKKKKFNSILIVLLILIEVNLFYVKRYRIHMRYERLNIPTQCNKFRELETPDDGRVVRSKEGQ
jgi:hypothetical protein